MCVTFGTGNDARCHTLQSAYVFQDVKEPAHHSVYAAHTLLAATGALLKENVVR
jgi:hypothetical protein